ncbi:J domain-containing protein [Altererythrobacter sp. KTW20L]|uniref:J domain-containing protein n=1 Tax=Altererythrobacter sp. KTW20L TaxID=2942210 RepID=UPI0020BD7463|nr:J domain-containing protein [Altererythrobacter sp. KTW20L]MCL6249856.1 J domain-containing protein [Altererythrobacter sp. KTW20L]
MMKLVVLAGAICVGYKLITGRWPWEKKLTTRQQAVFRARQLLGVEAQAGREEILAAHKRLVAMVHPDRGGTNDQVHEANAARDLLIDELPGRLGS